MRFSRKYFYIFTKCSIKGRALYLRDANDNRIHGRSVSDGDKITVLDVGYTKQLALVQYTAGSVVRQGYLTNVPSIIKYFKKINGIMEVLQSLY
ncbi:hypothetical protein ACV3R5_15515 [Clostridium perfringens]|uniref:hypothetical protein n=1 Tax=Clostridium perfringens TaxID=1502 RepID=UPI0029032241|nr:hypothetical protein [Clostridium perfringens]MDU3020271.1 hypothetical protein [Clostridium perfringens]